jgi:hypothetical protein
MARANSVGNPLNNGNNDLAQDGLRFERQLKKCVIT